MQNWYFNVFKSKVKILNCCCPLYNMCTDKSDENSRPITPSDEDCCHNSCDPCIFDIHQRLLEEYERKKKEKVKKQNEKNLLCLSSYRNFTIVGMKRASDCYILLTLKYEGNVLRYNGRILIDPGQHVMLHLNDTTKPFTPISFTDDTIEFLIRLYPNGKFSSHLEEQQIGDIIRIRGPYGKFKYECNRFQTVIMFSMGSGIAAGYPVAKSITDNELEETKVHLIGCFQNVSQIPLKRELQLLTDYWNFECSLHISQVQNNTSNLHGINMKYGRLNKKSVSEVLEDKTASTTLVLICGTSEFNRSVEQWVKCINFTHVHVFE